MQNLKNKRKSIKTKLTNFSKFVQKIEKTISENSDVDFVKFTELQERYAIAKLLIDEFYYIHNEILNIEEHTESDLGNFEEFENNYFQTISKAKSIIGKLTTPAVEARPNTPVRSRSSSVGSGNLDSRNHPRINLPKINLVKFSGKTENWLEFKAIFKSLINDNLEINDVQKLHYLKGSLSGSASEVIQSLEFVPENYRIAWETLLSRYDQPKLLIKNHLTSIVEMEAIKRESAQKLREMHDAIFKHISAAKSLATAEQLFEANIIYLVSAKLDSITLREWENVLSKNDADIPTLDQFKKFLNCHANLLENIEKKQVNNEKPKINVKTFVTQNSVCGLCNQNHHLSRCDKFAELTVVERSKKAQELKVCFNCLAKGHFNTQCSSSFRCRRCRGRHNTLLHQVREGNRVSSGNRPSRSASPVESVQVTTALCLSTTQVLLPVVSARVLDSRGKEHNINILLDSASMSNFVSRELVNRLDLQTKPVNVSVWGLNKSNSRARSRCELEVRACHSSFKVSLSYLVVDEITGLMPGFAVNRNDFKIPDNIKLSNSNFNQDTKVDLLIGAIAFFDLLCVGKVSLGKRLPTLQNTKFGWTIAGPINSAQDVVQVQCHTSTSCEVQDLLTKFWEIDSYPTEKSLSVEENACEMHYVNHTRRDADGRFVVTIPFKQPITLLGDSLPVATKMFHALERRFQAKPELSVRYHSFMREYEDLGHMSLCDPKEEASFFLPHHGVLKEDSLTTKLRVVFNGSALTTSGHSLNSIQMVGPTIQQDLFTILIRFRQHRYAISADIEKMYRQVNVEPSQRSLQRILWRSAPTDKIQAYNLNTVTYGTASASYLAIRSLTQLGNDCQDSMPEISRIIKQDFYVDDLLTGCDSIQKGIEICSSISNILTNGCFNLRKWISNEPEILSNISNDDIHPSVLEFGDYENTRTLGLIWSCQTDHLMFSISLVAGDAVATKRLILSKFSQVFDPLGLLAPVTIVAKIIMQRLWMHKLDWDDPVPPDIQIQWNSYVQELAVLNDVRIPRYTVCENSIKIELHGFCDASIQAYGACIYLRSINCAQEVHVRILCSKSRVAPLTPMTVPKLELCGALLLSKLYNKVLKSLNLKVHQCYLWTDSTVVLGWLKTNPSLLKTFVCNRVADIQRLTQEAVWKHVSTKTNPADILSRGCNPQDLKDFTLWWIGPPWLQRDESVWPVFNPSSLKLPEFKKDTQSLLVINKHCFLFSRYSSLTKLEKIIAYLLRFKQNCLLKKELRHFGPLTTIELANALKTLAKLSQQESFSDEFKLLSNSKDLKISPLLKLNPFIHTDGMIRVGGRLRLSSFSYDKKHPIVIDGKHPFSKLLVEREHIRMLHAGAQLLLSSIRDKFWITSGRSLTRQTVFKCVKCFRFSPRTPEPIMGNLPPDRIKQAHPFNVVGVDYAGPLLIKDRRGRGAKSSKAYICLFVCFATKAVHLELVTDLSTESFLLSFRRFASRRGKPSRVFSDNGTNFVGANSELRDLAKFLKTKNEVIREKMTSENVDWHFIPAHSPHFGGLWEAGVRSCKFHLKRIVGNSLLTFEELCTFLIQIEAVLNSRPITPLSCDPNDLEPLTPGHFLIGRPMTSLADPDVTHVVDNRLTHFQRIQSLHQHFWKRWNKEYISELQQRHKWHQHHSDLQLNTLVLVKDDNMPPFKWKMGRVMEVHPGIDGINRVASIKTSSGLVRRSFKKLCPLPVNT